MDTETHLRHFVAWWSQQIKGDDPSEGPLFLERFLQALGYDSLRDAGASFIERPPRRVTEPKTGALVDLLLPHSAVIEMKGRGQDLRTHYHQAFQSWLESGSNRPNYLILCNFDDLWIYDLATQIDEPIDRLKVADLPDRWMALTFLLPKNHPEAKSPPQFENNQVGPTQQAAKYLSALFRSIHQEVPTVPAQRFILQCVVTLFAQGLGLLPAGLLPKLITDCQKGKENAHDSLTLLFTMMNIPTVKRYGRFKGVDYFNGGIFAQIHPIQLGADELGLLGEAAKLDWAKIRPAILGPLLASSMAGAESEFRELSFTPELDIQRILQPVIVRPWLTALGLAAEDAEELIALHERLTDYQVLDPACGSGNFLVLAYREMKRLEGMILGHLYDLEADYTPTRWVSAHQFWGYDISPFAVELAKVMMTAAKMLAVGDFGLSEAPLPLDDLSANFRVGDALFDEWPPFDACISDLPALSLPKDALADYGNALHQAFPDLREDADYSAYWLSKAHDMMPQDGRAGMVVALKTITQQDSLDYLLAQDGHIFEAYPALEWGDGRVSIVCWNKGDYPIQTPILWQQKRKKKSNPDGPDNLFEAQEVPRITSSLSAQTDVSSAATLACNTTPKRVFQGQTHGHIGFVLSSEKARNMAYSDPKSEAVIFAYMTGDDLLGNVLSQPHDWIIDFEGRSVLEAGRHKRAFKHVEINVLPDRQAKAEKQAETNARLLALNPQANVNHDHETAFARWWQHFRSRPELKEAVKSLSRYIACSRVTKRPIFEFISPQFCAGDSLQAFAFEDDYSFGILQSTVHREWFLARSSTLREDYRYTANSIFATFPFPQFPADEAVTAIAEAARALYTYRRDSRMSLHDLYHGLEASGDNPLRDLHAALDEAVLSAYGFAPDGDILADLLALNQTVAEKIAAGEAVTGPGIPPDYANPADLIGPECIQPPVLR